jgi:anaphase-promoting complex subunit 5
LREALNYLLKAESDWKQLQMLNQLMDAQFLLSVVYHNLDMPNERDEAIKRHSSTDEERNRMDSIVYDEETQRILELVSDVGAALAGR